MLVIFLFSQIACQCPFGKGTLMEIVDLGMRNGLSTEIQEIFWQNTSTRKFIDELILNCRHNDLALVKMVSPRDRKTLLKIFDNAQMLDQRALGQLGIDKTQLLDVVARLKGFENLWDKIFDDIKQTKNFDLMALHSEFVLRNSGGTSCFRLTFKSCFVIQSRKDALFLDQFVNHPEMEQIIFENYLTEELQQLNVELRGYLRKTSPLSAPSVRKAGIFQGLFSAMCVNCLSVVLLISIVI